MEGPARRVPPAPFLKWAGGKRWLARLAPSLVPGAPTRYFEPFLGSGAVFFATQPTSSFLSDSNRPLIETFRMVRDDPDGVITALASMSYGKRSYYRTRKTVPETAPERAARFIYLNKCCWNGLYRVNQQGVFNVPFGPRENVPKVCDEDGIRAASIALKRVKLAHCGFQKSIAKAGSDDFVFADPPYTVMHGDNGFVKYNDRIFSWADQELLHEGLLRLHERGGLFLMSNADHPSIRGLYKGFLQRKAYRTSVLAADSRFRRPVTELLITNYSLGHRVKGTTPAQ